LKILGIDDNIDINKLLSTVAKADGHDFRWVDNGRDGLKCIREEKFDAVLLDLAMPGFSGDEVIDSLVKENIIKKQPIILFTASSKTDEEIHELIKKGAHSCIRKPTNIQDLLKKLREISAEKSK